MGPGAPNSIGWRTDPYFLTQVPSFYPRVLKPEKLGGDRGVVRWRQVEIQVPSLP